MDSCPALQKILRGVSRRRLKVNLYTEFSYNSSQTQFYIKEYSNVFDIDN